MTQYKQEKDVKARSFSGKPGQQMPQAQTKKTILRDQDQPVRGGGRDQ